MLEIYRYLREQGVAGRLSYMAHPIVTGDTDYWYDQRISHDRKMSCLIIKHKAAGEVTLRPQGLLPEHAYHMSFEVATRR